MVPSLLNRILVGSPVYGLDTPELRLKVASCEAAVTIFSLLETLNVASSLTVPVLLFATGAELLTALTVIVKVAVSVAVPSDNV